MCGIVLARAITHVSVARVRTAGFEMLWCESTRVVRLARGQEAELAAEIRNRDTRAARFVGLRSVHAPELEVKLDPDSGEVPAGGRLRVRVQITAHRVGRYGIHGLSLEVRGAPGLFEVPLTFANPFGVLVVPRVASLLSRSPRGGRSRFVSHAGRPGPLSGDGTELRELREHQPGDPFRRIAWKASARRRALMVCDYEREERDRVWLLLDGSVELWSGDLGWAPLDLALDELASVADRHLRQQDSVGLAVIAGRVLSWVPPEQGIGHLARIQEALADVGGTVDSDRSDLDEEDVAGLVLEHMRPLDPPAAQRVRANDLERIARRAERVIQRSPWPGAQAYAGTARERSLRRYLVAFGVGTPVRQQAERPRTDTEMARILGDIVRQRPRPTLVYVWSPAPDPEYRPGLVRALARYPRRRIELRWIPMTELSNPAVRATPRALVASFAVAERVRAARERGEHALRRLGVRVERLRRRHPEGHSV
ncbi:DUF58 domain-containing protein [Myxococcota bacterium]